MRLSLLSDMSKEIPSLFCSVGVFPQLVVGACLTNLMLPNLFHSIAEYNTSVRNFVNLIWISFGLDNFKDSAEVKRLTYDT